MKTATATTIDKFKLRAAEEGLLDVAYVHADSPFGPLLLAQTKKGLVRVGLPNQDQDELLVDLAERVSPRVLEAPAELDAVRRELDLYFEGKLERFDLPLVVPCHRVLRTGGALGGYGGGLPMKQALLEMEGVLEPKPRS
jgi:O6-methylguanine-DNA--protein-cysteine methyltransferase